MKSLLCVTPGYRSENDLLEWRSDHPGGRHNGVQEILVCCVAKSLVNRCTVRPETAMAINFDCAVFRPTHERATLQGFHACP